MKNQSRNLEMLITAGFYEPFTAANAIEALNQLGFEDADIGMVGLLDAPDTDLTWFWQAIGVPLEHALYYQSSFEDGGLLLIVRARESMMKKTVLAVLYEHGGMIPPTIH